MKETTEKERKKRKEICVSRRENRWRKKSRIYEEQSVEEDGVGEGQ